MQMDLIYEQDDLGAVCRQGKTWFKVWSPPATGVTVELYQDGDQSPALERHQLIPGTDGVWSLEIHRNLHGVYYDYQVTAEGETRRTADPYARACGVNGARSMVVDLTKTDPPGWNLDAPPEKTAEDIIYEVHVKEFSWDPSGGFLEAVRGTYRAFLEEDTTLYGDGVHPTGMAYLKKLGVTHIQLMPVFDFGSVDEKGDKAAFNWGYDPVNYNVPEGSYATDPCRGEVRIRELKELVMALHKQGFRVIMDVVYNHTHHADSWLERTVPGYYYRRKKDGTLYNGSACGNDVASEKPMCSRYIRDSVLYWAREYHMDGFRFDLMGLLDVELMNGIQQDLDDAFGPGEKLLYGEPWAAGPSPMEEGSIPALKANVRLLNPRIGMFCDGTRDAIRGHVFEAEIPGFVSGGKGLEEAVLCGTSAWCGAELEVPALAPSQIITYSSAHDNHTLWDRLVINLSGKRDFHSLEPALVRANKLAAAICYTCQGRMFLLSGEEFGRTKEGIEDSYQSPVEINRLDWNRAYENQELVEYYRGLMELRKRLPGLCDKSRQAPERITNKKIESRGCVSFCVEQADQGEACRWSRLFVVYNSRKQARTVELPDGEWEILADGRSSSRWKEEKPQTVRNQVKAAAVSAMILGRI